MLESFFTLCEAFVYEYGFWGLLLYSFAEVIILPFPVDPFITGAVFFGMTVQESLLSSVLGSIFGSVAGYFCGKIFGDTVLLRLFSQKTLQKGYDACEKYGVLAVFIGAVTPIPYTIVVWGAGMLSFKFLPFFLISTFARFLRFFLVAYFSGALFA